jgi:DNA replication protein DnaC
VDHWHAWIGDATIADAILDRIMQRNHRLTLTGDSLCAEQSKTTKKEEYRLRQARTFFSLK